MSASSASERLIPLFTDAQIRDRVGELAAEIHRDYHSRDLIVIGVLKGAFVFVADLVRELGLPLRIDFATLSSYRDSTESSGAPAITQPLTIDIHDTDILIVEDIVDTGLSMTALFTDLWARRPRSVRLCALIDKRERRQASVPVDYVGFEVPTGFVVGYGIDYAERYRHLPAIYRLELDGPDSEVPSPPERGSGLG